VAATGRRDDPVTAPSASDSSLRRAAPIPNSMAPRLTLLRCGVCKREKAHVVERVNGVLTFTCKHCGTTVVAAQASR